MESWETFPSNLEKLHISCSWKRNEGLNVWSQYRFLDTVIHICECTTIRALAFLPFTWQIVQFVRFCLSTIANERQKAQSWRIIIDKLRPTRGPCPTPILIWWGWPQKNNNYEFAESRRAKDKAPKHQGKTENVVLFLQFQSWHSQNVVQWRVFNTGPLEYRPPWSYHTTA